MLVADGRPTNSMLKHLKEGTQPMAIYTENYTGFVYLWYDTKRKWFCIGSHMGSLEDGYTSSTGFMGRAIKKRPHDFKRRILYYYNGTDQKELLAEEQKFLDRIKVEELCIGQNKKKGTIRYYNIKKTASGLGGETASIIFKDAWDNNPGRKKNQSERLTGSGNPMFGKTGVDHPRFGKEQTPETRLKIKKAKTGVKPSKEPWNKGKKCPSISEGKKKKPTVWTDEMRMNMSISQTGKKQTVDTRKNISKALKGVPKSEEHRLKLKAKNELLYNRKIACDIRDILPKAKNFGILPFDVGLKQFWWKKPTDELESIYQEIKVRVSNLM
jgi:hypothetical protein